MKIFLLKIVNFILIIKLKKKLYYIVWNKSQITLLCVRVLNITHFSQLFSGFIKNIQQGKSFKASTRCFFLKTFKTLTCNGIKQSAVFIWFKTKVDKLKNEFISNYLKEYKTVLKFLEKFIKIEKSPVQKTVSKIR